MQPKSLIHLLLVTTLLSASFTPARAAGPRCYVDNDAGGANTGADWTNAYTNLQTALSDPACTEIWIAAGTYKPGASGDRAATFQLKSGVALYGGFAGNETVLEDRDWTANATILSGDLDSSGDHTDNDAYHVVTASGTDATAILDGFTVSGGNANGDYDGSRGGGMYSYGGNPSLANITFSSNTAWEDGGGLFGNGSLTNVTFSNNAAGSNGGGMSGGGTLTNVTFSRNTAADNGGGLLSYSGSMSLTNVTFRSNTAEGSGGGMSGSGNLTNVFFFDNSAVDGGGIDITGDATLINVTLSHNTAQAGGGIYNRSVNTSLANSILWGNTAARYPQIGNHSYSTTKIAYSDIQGAFAGGSWDNSLGTNEGGNKDIDPRFVNAAAGDLRLQDGSPVINAGDNTRLPADTNDLDGDGDTAEPVPYDLDNDPRVKGGVVDMGVYETR